MHSIFALGRTFKFEFGTGFAAVDDEFRDEGVGVVGVAVAAVEDLRGGRGTVWLLMLSR
jgi:hypothetical protein